MAHRSIREDERCPYNSFTGVHNWELTTEQRLGEGQTVTVNTVTCHKCHAVADPQTADRVISAAAAIANRTAIQRDSQLTAQKSKKR